MESCSKCRWWTAGGSGSRWKVWPRTGCTGSLWVLRLRPVLVQWPPPPSGPAGTVRQAHIHTDTHSCSNMPNQYHQDQRPHTHTHTMLTCWCRHIPVKKCILKSPHLTYFFDQSPLRASVSVQMWHRSYIWLSGSGLYQLLGHAILETSGMCRFFNGL